MLRKERRVMDVLRKLYSCSGRNILNYSGHIKGDEEVMKHEVRLAFGALKDAKDKLKKIQDEIRYTDQLIDYAVSILKEELK